MQIAIRPHSNIMRTIAHINARSVWMDHFQTRVLRSQPPRQFLSLLSVPLLVYRHPCSPRWKLGPVRPGDERFMNLPNGVEWPQLQGPCHHASDRQYPGHACDRARSASEVSALACRTESLIRFANTGNSRQVSGASDASKMQFKLVTRQYPDHVDTVHLHAREGSAAGRLLSSRLLASNAIVTARAFVGTNLENPTAALPIIWK